jgi:hypothetical protein
LSLSGGAIVVDPERALVAQNGGRVRLFINEVGFVSGGVVRQTQRLLAVAFEATDAVEHDLLIRKLFTSGFDTTNVKVCTWSATIAMLRSIWSARVELPAGRSRTLRCRSPRPPRRPTSYRLRVWLSRRDRGRKK